MTYLDRAKTALVHCFIFGGVAFGELIMQFWCVFGGGLDIAAVSR